MVVHIRPKYSSPLPINLLYTHHLSIDSCMVHYVDKKFSQYDNIHY